MSSLKVQLEKYEGPLDLLLDLIRKQEIDIYDIPIASITQQYLAYMEQAAALDIELSADFVYMAATLIHIKSKMLLPRDPELEKIAPEEDPRQELVERLLEHERYKQAAEMLQQKRLLEEAVWSNPRIREFLTEPQDPGLDVTLFDLVKTFQAVLERLKNRPVYSVTRETVTVQEMIRLLASMLADAPAGQRFSATELFEKQTSRQAAICLFLAILELVRRQILVLEQAEAFGDVLIARSATFEEALPNVETAAEDYR